MAMTHRYWMIDRPTARYVVLWLSREYEVVPPSIGDRPPAEGYMGQYFYDIQFILIHRRSHIKTVFREWYHHLDNVTRGAYDSDDRRGGPTSLAWQFADRVWEELVARG